jgi:hypothetical protein
MISNVKLITAVEMFEFIMRQLTLDCSVGLGPTVFWIRIGSVGLQGMRLSVVI